MIERPPVHSVSRFGDVAHLGHLELLTPKPDASLAFFTSVVGLHESGRSATRCISAAGATTNGTRSS